MSSQSLDYVSVEQVSRELHLTKRRVYQFLEEGSLKATRLGKWIYLINRAELEAFKRTLTERRALRGVVRPIDFGS